MTVSRTKAMKPREPRARRKRGHVSSYTPSIARAICDRLARGGAQNSLRAICRTTGMPPESTVRQWVVDNVDGFATHYVRARDLALDVMAEEIVEIADDGSNDRSTDEEGNTTVNHDVVNRSKLRVDARKWLVSKLAPKKYGDRLDLNVAGHLALRAMSDEDLEAEIARLEGKNE